jgi:hypothetical protein
VDDLLDHMLPDNWRDHTVRPGPISHHALRAPRGEGR